MIIFVQIAGTQSLADDFGIVQLTDDAVRDVAAMLQLFVQTGRSSEQVHLLDGVGESSQQQSDQYDVAEYDFGRSGKHGLTVWFGFISEP